jgi:hypothetical protein
LLSSGLSWFAGFAVRALFAAPTTHSPTHVPRGTFTCLRELAGLAGFAGPTSLIPNRSHCTSAFYDVARHALTRVVPVDKLWITCVKVTLVQTLLQHFIHGLSTDNPYLSTGYPQVIHRLNRDNPRKLATLFAGEHYYPTMRR